MHGSTPSYRFGEFGEFMLDGARGCLFHGDKRIHLRPKTFEVLGYLLRNGDRLISKDELLSAAWPQTVVTEDSLTRCISELRSVLGDGAQRIIRTVAKRGYVFAQAAVDVVSSGKARSLAHEDNSAQAAPLHGRSEELAAVLSLVDARQIVTIVGAGGIGKTSLARSAAHACAAKWADGVWIVELASVADPALVPARVAQAIGIWLAGRSEPSEELVAVLSGQSMLLVLDNSEHLVEAVSALVQSIALHAPRVHVLATSQERLKVAGEHVFRLAPLGVPSIASLEAARSSGAVALFVERARAMDPGFDLTERNVEPIVDICRRLDGMPLAIELAAARVLLLGVQGVRDKLGERFRVLVGGPRSALPRHQTLRGAFEWSHSLLSRREQVVYRRLGTFVGAFTLEMAQAVVTGGDVDEWAVFDDIGTLVDRSLITVSGSDRHRYRLLESARVHACDQLVRAGELDRLQARHARALRAFLETRDSDVLEGRLGVDRHMEELLPELDNIRAAVSWAMGPSGDIETALSLVTHSMFPMRYFGQASECRRWIFELHGRMTDSMPAWLEARYWVMRGVFSHRGGLPARERIAALERAKAICHELGDDIRLGFVLEFLAHMWLKAGDLATAQRCQARLEALHRTGWPPLLRASVILRRGVILAAEGQPVAALTAYARAASLFQAAGDSRSLFGLQVEIADLQLRLGNIDLAVQENRRLADFARSHYCSNHVIGLVLVNLVRSLTADDRLDEAHVAALESLPHLERSADVRAGCDSFGWLLARQGHFADAARLLGAAEAWLRHSGEGRLPRDAYAHEAALALLRKRHSQADMDCWLTEGATLAKDDVVRVLSA